MGGICLYRDSSGNIDTYHYTLNDFVQWIDKITIEGNQGDYEDKATSNIGQVSTSNMEYTDYFGCTGGSSTDYIYTCKVYQPKTEYAVNGHPRFGGGEVAWAYHMDADIDDIPVVPYKIILTHATVVGGCALLTTALASLIMF